MTGFKNSFSMAVRRNTQLEKVIEDVSKSTSLEELHGHLQSIIGEEKPIKCSKHFLSKLDKLMCMTLDRCAYKAAILCLNIIGKHGRHLHAAGCAPGLSGIITQGLVKKINFVHMVQWFEKCRNLWVNGGPHWNETLLSLCEDFSDTLLEVHGACDEGTNEVTESFLYLLGHLAVDTRIYILIRKEAMRKFNIILDKIPAALKKKKISSSKEASDIMLKLAAQILDGGDYDFQTALTESLCRMASSNRRKELAGQWFSISHVATAFVKIRDAEFETDCRKFLNLVNGMQGDLRRVYSYPCLGTFLDQHELSMPADENLEEFWIDFNLGSRSISFYFSLADDGAEEGQWETFSVIENEVESYTVAEKGKRKVLQIRLPDGVHLGAVEGSSLSIHFNSSLDIQQAACKVFGEDKRKSFMAKKDNSVVKTEIRIQMVEDGSQLNMSVQSKASEQASINTGGKYKKNVPVQMDQAELQTQHSQEDCVVPDTQPKTGKNTSLRWRRQSVSEMIMMPTQKMSSLPTLALLNMNVREDVIVRESVKACCASSMPPQKPKNSLQTKVNGRELEGNVPLEAEKQAGASKSLQKQTRICKSKEKSQANAVAGNMVKIISSHYKYSRSEKKQKVLSPPFVTRNDVFAFNMDSPLKTENKNLKRHLFSDTDTDHSLEVSWLKESHKKPCVAKYSRQAPIKLASTDPQDAPRVSPKLVKGKPRAKKKTANTRKPAQQPNKPVKSAAAVEPQRTASRRPQRAAASFTKSYRETDTDDSLSASEYSVGKDTFRFTRWNNKKKSETVTPSSPTESVMAPPVSKCGQGPCPGVSFSSSDSEAEERQKSKSKSKARSKLQMKPRRLFNSCKMTHLNSCLVNELSAEAEKSQVVSSFHTVSSAGADGAEEGFSFEAEDDVRDISVKPENLCQQLNFEIKKKCQMRCKMMELYNQQSLKTVQQHVSSINMLVQKDRTQRLEEVGKTLLGEIQKLEQEDLTLKTMEKDLITSWKKQSTSFHSYREQETKRNETLKTVLQGTMCHTLEYEERIFTSQMGLIMKDMKSAQDRLMIDMQQKEIQNIKQGLHALFFPGGGEM
ncbi:uncharacterized protein sycp2 [Neosynchiropus ocellatus]